MKRTVVRNRHPHRLLGAGFAALLLGFLLTVSLPGASSGEYQGNDRKGKYLFKHKCKQCHDPEKGQGEVKVSPSQYTKKQWEGFFKRNKHRRKQDISDMFTEEDLIDVRTYLINHAADSDQPETCG